MSAAEAFAPLPAATTADRSFRAAAAVTLGALAIVNIYAAFEWRGLFADGAYYFLRLLQTQDFVLWEPARRTVHVLQQLPTLAALRLGVDRVEALVVVYSLTLQLLPLALTAACCPLLPRRERYLFVFPLAHYLLGTVPASFAPIVEGPVAAGCFWLLLTLILLGRGRVALAATLVLALPALFLHETTVILAPVLAAAAILRARGETASRRRALFGFLAAWFVAVTVAQAGFILFPRSAENRADVLLTMLLFGLADFNGINVPGVLAVFAIAAAIGIWRTRTPQTAWHIALGFGSLCLIAVVVTAIRGETSRLVALWPQFAARNNAVVMSLPLGVCFLAAAQNPDRFAAWLRPPMVAVVLFLALGQAGWHMLGVYYWSAFLADFRMALATHNGYVPWRAVIAAVPADQAARMQRFAWYWTNPLLSIVLSPDGRVATIIGSVDEKRWQPFDATKPEQLPRIPHFDFAPYRAALAADPPSESR